ncbi:MAG: MFS transporter [Acidobacteriia bacterium]|nr:MFS transporter [Terriglobia bacterium]
MVRSPLLAIFLIVAVDVLGLTIMIPLLPFYAEKMGASPTEVGWLIGIYAACQLFSGPLLGRLSDHTGRKPLLLVSQAGTCTGFLITAFAPSLWILFVARAIDGCTAGNLSLAQAYISDVTEPKDRAKSFGIIGIAFGLGFLIGPAISGLLAKYDYRYPIFAAAALSATSIITTYLLLPAVTPAGAGKGIAGPGGKRLSLVQWGAYAEYFRQPALAPKLWQFLSFTFSFSMFIAGMPLVLERRLTWAGKPFGPEQVGYTWAFAGLVGILLQGPALGRLVKRFGERALNRTGFMSYACGYALLAFCHSIPMLALATVVSTIGGLVRPTLTSLITQATPREEQGVVLGLTQSLNSVSMIVAPPLGGFLIERGWLTAWGLAASGVAVIGLMLASGSTDELRENSPPVNATVP